MLSGSSFGSEQPSVISVTRLLTAEHNIATLGRFQPNEGPESMTFYEISYSVESSRVYKPATRLRRTEFEELNLDLLRKCMEPVGNVCVMRRLINLKFMRLYLSVGPLGSRKYNSFCRISLMGKSFVKA
ncbi:hypothetical protein LguiA_011436 [Lonicera macranthoides]